MQMTTPEVLLDYISSHDFDGFRNCVPSAREIDRQTCYMVFEMLHEATLQNVQPIYLRICEKCCQDLLTTTDILMAVSTYDVWIRCAEVYVRTNPEDDDLVTILCDLLRNRVEEPAICAIMFRRGMSYEDASRLITNIQVPDDNDELRLLSHDLLFPDQND